MDRILQFVSQFMTLLPGDLIATGTPEGIGPLQQGDVVEVFVEGIGTLRNPVVDE
jgi:2-keto-4-pentenoate hydratase/2-oxohepta-3-ene-1,7-dioic acid hydratase in catechol pathway